MIKKIPILCILLISSLSNTYAQTVEFYDKTDTTKTIPANQFDIEFESSIIDGITTLNISLINKSDDFTIMLLDKDYTKETLKREHKTKYSISCSDRNDAQEIKGHRCEAYFGGRECEKWISNRPVYIASGDRCDIIKIEYPNDETKKIEITLPIYYVKHKCELSKKWRICSVNKDFKFTIDLDVEYAEKYNEFDSRYRALCTEYESTVFCNNRNHKPSFENQKEDFENKKGILIHEINSYINSRYFDQNDPHRVDFDNLISSIQDLNVDKKAKDCGEHKSAPKQQPSLEYISNQLEDIHTEIYNRKAKKSEKMSQVEKLYEQATKHSNWKNSDYRTKIVIYYNEIKNL